MEVEGLGFGEGELEFGFGLFKGFDGFEVDQGFGLVVDEVCLQLVVYRQTHGFTVRFLRIVHQLLVL